MRKESLSLTASMLIGIVDSGADGCEGEKYDVQYRNEEEEPETQVKGEARQQKLEALFERVKPSSRNKIRIIPGEKNGRNSRGDNRQDRSQRCKPA